MIRVEQGQVRCQVGKKTLLAACKVASHAVILSLSSGIGALLSEPSRISAVL